MIRRLTTMLAVALAAATVSAGSLAQGVSADPINAKDSFTVPFTCAGTTVEFVKPGGLLIGNGEMTPGHVVGSTRTFIPQSFDLTFVYTPTGGAPTIERFTPSKKNPHGDLVTCTLNWTRSTAEGTIVGTGTLTGYFTPAR